MKTQYEGLGVGENHRAEVLYWKEALFSPAKNTSYRDLSADGAIYWTAHDLHNLIPRFHPVSVEFFLRESVRSAVGEKEAKEKGFAGAVPFWPQI